MSVSILEMVMACLVMGLGIGADVALATFLQANTMGNKRAVLFWIVGVTLTHTLFPMIGYLLAHFSIYSAPMISPVIGLVAFSFIAYFVIDELDVGSEETDDSNNGQILVTVGLILTVSWDALWSGPAKSAQVIGWPDYWVWSSFLIVGLVVSVFSIVSYFLAKQVDIKIRQPKWMSFDFGQWVQLSVVSYFGLLALLRYTFDVQWLWWKLLMVSFILMAIILHRIAIKNIAIKHVVIKSLAIKDVVKKGEGDISSLITLS
ncbi:MAG: hypothetical protein JKY50_02165 [Oleispira sp.]|nr:hypothetical protein [Oleispira sp.]MBL4881062.1 hypothetical protein [Oleispira sp.]